LETRLLQKDKNPHTNSIRFILQHRFAFLQSILFEAVIQYV